MNYAIVYTGDTATLSYRGNSIRLGIPLLIDSVSWTPEKVYPSPFVQGVTNVNLRRT